jgi:hypothetical protein
MIAQNLSEKQKTGTNLEIIDTYFAPLSSDMLDMLTMETWINCNTLKDYNSIYSLL